MIPGAPDSERVLQSGNGQISIAFMQRPVVVSRAFTPVPVGYIVCSALDRHNGNTQRSRAAVEARVASARAHYADADGRVEEPTLPSPGAVKWA